MSNEVVADIVQKMQSHISEDVQPGQPAEFTEACVAGDGIWQGDLGILVVDAVPEGYTKHKISSADDLQLVPEGGLGSRHILASKEGVTMYRPANWGEDGSLDGPVLKLETANEITHPRHGNVKIPAGFMVRCFYQREYDAELKRERRARD